MPEFAVGWLVKTPFGSDYIEDGDDQILIFKTATAAGEAVDNWIDTETPEASDIEQIKLIAIRIPEIDG